MTNKDFTDRLTILDDFVSCGECIEHSLDYLLDQEQGNISGVLQMIRDKNVEWQKIANIIYKQEADKLKIL